MHTVITQAVHTHTYWSRK